MSILDRLQRLARAEFTALRGGDSSADDVRGAVRDAKVAARDLRREQRKLHHDIQSLLDASQRWEDRAVLALKRGDERLAHDALTKKQQVDEQLEERRLAFDRVSTQLADMRSSLEALHLRVQAGSERRDASETASPAYSSNFAPASSPPTPSDLPSLDADLAHFREMEARIDQNEAWSLAEDDLDLDGRQEAAALDSRFRDLEAGASLASLKSQATAYSPATDSAPGAAPGPADDDALAKLRARMNRD